VTGGAVASVTGAVGGAVTGAAAAGAAAGTGTGVVAVAVATGGAIDGLVSDDAAALAMPIAATMPNIVLAPTAVATTRDPAAGWRRRGDVARCWGARAAGAAGGGGGGSG
jgi:hypothetical protein